MAYRNGTYVAFAADGATNILTSDIKYYRLIQAWNLMKNREFSLINSHEKGPSIRRGSLEETIKGTLRERLKNSNRLLLLVGKTTKLDDDFVPYEIEYAVKTCNLPVIVCYVTYRNRITNNLPFELENLLPSKLADLIKDDSVKTIHIPFRERILNRALNDFKFDKLPTYTITGYTDSFYDQIYGGGKI
ncbi:TIR domain-containing protein [Flavobacterium sp. NKUCC04_CG]|uniref:TIR domain-containing protein n=1 Tax=Flavobacterium sp. NKUCC04_CG TaxID=2842121 RepID=UPI001C5B4257|nr:TIR domain-containing protein [Flavobacterium sp. NKUCC04_CG]MBW3518061.1 TIR domain-containing protein [Flavobacterium sp. NKUCC04_CG]